MWAVAGLSHLGDLMFCKKLCTRRDAWAGEVWWSCQSPVVLRCSLLSYPNSFWGRMLKLNAKFDAYSLLYSVILTVMATQYICSLNSVYHLCWLVQWSHCSHMCIPVHSPWLPSYIDVAQTILIIILYLKCNNITLTMAGLFPDRPQYYRDTTIL